MNHHLAESGRVEDLASRVEIAVEEVLSKQYIRFCPSDAWRPNINVYETEEATVVCVDLAGMRPEAITVDVQGDFLVLSGERARPIPKSPAKMVGVHLMEIDAGAFCRQVEIPGRIDRDNITANYREGLLWITLPKKF